MIIFYIIWAALQEVKSLELEISSGNDDKDAIEGEDEELNL